MTDPSSNQAQPEDVNDRQFTPVRSAVHRKVSVKGSGGVSATVIVIAQHGGVWMSIMPPFTWEAIMEPGKVDELIRTLTVARDNAQRMVSSTRAQTPGGDKGASTREITGEAGTHAITNETAARGNKAIGPKKAQP